MLVIIVISIPFLKEGVICLLMGAPILFLAMLMGATMMHLFCRFIWKSKALHGVALLPLVVLGLPIAPQNATYQVTNQVTIAATPAQVWQAINHVDTIAPQQFYTDSWLLPLLQVPPPKSAETVWQNGHWVRKSQWYGGIYFDEPIISQIPNRQLRWRFVFYPDSVPKGTLDDHVTINGEYFKLLLGQYDIIPIDATHTRLTFTGDYRISTNLNFYAGFWGKWVMQDFSKDVLTFYKRRLERSSSIIE